MKNKITNLYTISPDAITYDAIVKIEENKYGSILVVDNNKVLGTISDGDIRKLLINHNMLTVPTRYVMNQNYTYVLEGKENDAQEIFEKSFYIRLIPVINEDGELKDIIKRT